MDQSKISEKRKIEFGQLGMATYDCSMLDKIQLQKFELKLSCPSLLIRKICQAE